MRPGSLDTMARVKRWELDRLRREMSELQKLRDDLQGRDLSLEQSLQREAQIVRGGEGDTDYALFAQRINEQRNSLAEAIEDASRRIDKKQIEISDLFQEVKRFEIVEERMLKRAAREIEKREQADLDEVGLVNHLRRRSRNGG